LTRLACLLVVAWWVGGSIASADTVTIEAYRGRLREARSFVAVARTAARPQQPALLSQAALILRTTSAISLTDGSTLPIDDSALAARLGGDDDALIRAIADLDARIAMADAASSSRATGALVDERLRSVMRAPPAPTGDPGPLELFLGLVGLVVAFVSRGVFSAVDPYFVYAVAAGLGIAVALLVLGILGRGVRERIRHEALAGDVRVGETQDPTAHLRLADAAIASGRPRDALHELYLFALAMLAAHGAIRFDPALTDRELLARAAAIPEIGSLRALVALHERAWFGLKPADLDDAARARELAARVAA
jgi:hypothetical protein